MHGRSGEETGATRLDGLYLSLRPGQPLKALGELGAVKVHAVSCLDGTERPASLAANETANGSAVDCVQRTVLLCPLSVGCERRRELVGGRGRMGMRSVVDLGGRGALAQEADHGLAGEHLGCIHCRCEGEIW